MSGRWKEVPRWRSSSCRSRALQWSMYTREASGAWETSVASNASNKRKQILCKEKKRGEGETGTVLKCGLCFSSLDRCWPVKLFCPVQLGRSAEDTLSYSWNLKKPWEFAWVMRVCWSHCPPEFAQFANTLRVCLSSHLWVKLPVQVELGYCAFSCDFLGQMSWSSSCVAASKQLVVRR